MIYPLITMKADMDTTYARTLIPDSTAELLVTLDFESKEIRSALVTTSVYQKNEDGTLRPAIIITDAQLRSIGEAKKWMKMVPFTERWHTG
jgi:hypothetical protein